MSSESDLTRDEHLWAIATNLSLAPNLIRALVAVEASKFPWVIDGEALTRIEIHQVWDRWPKAYRPLLDEWVHVDGQYHYLPQGRARTGPFKDGRWQGHRYRVLASAVPDGYPVLRVAESLDRADRPGGPREYVWVSLHDFAWTPNQHRMQVACRDRLTSLASLIPGTDALPAREAVFAAISYGGLQIMGFNHKLTGYATAEAMCVGYRHESAQLVGLAKFLLHPKNARLLAAFRAGDLGLIGVLYNGTGKPEDYARELGRALNRIRKQYPDDG